MFKKAVATLALLAVLVPAFAAQAFWTGRQVQVTTVTYQVAWNCEYNYLGQKFWRTYLYSCPSSVEVQ
jgi:hypothetical protein